MARCLNCGRRIAGPHEPCGPSAPAPDTEPVPALPVAPGFDIDGVLGHGGFSTVFAAAREADGVRVAFKVGRSGSGADLHREEVALRAVGPPAVPGVLGSGVLPDGSPFLVQELVQAPSLAALLESAAGPLPPDRLGPVALATLDALAAVHAAGYAHGDVKPENVFLLGEPLAARLIDLGLAQPLQGDERCLGTASFAGTPEYMSPEQCQGLSPDARSDVYAVGALLLEMATGRPPFFGPPAEVRHAHVNLRPPGADAFPEVAPALAEVIQRCLAKPPADRYASAAELRAALAPALAAPAERRKPGEPVTRASLPRSASRRVGVLYLESSAGPVALQSAAARLGGVLAHAEGGRFALLFDPAASENPVRLALRAARSIVARRLADRVLVDLATVTVRSRAGGADRYLCAAFAERSSWPRAGDPGGPLATARAAEVLVGVPLKAAPGREGLFLCLPEAARAESPTIVRQGTQPLLGRDALLDRLVEHADVASRGTPTAVAVLGEPGLGKSHLAAVLSQRLRARFPTPALLEVPGSPASEEGGTLGVLLRQILDLAPAAVAPQDGGRALLGLALPEEIVEESWPAVALALGWIPPESPLLSAIGAAPGALVSLAVRAAAALLRRRAAGRGLCVLLDDAHAAGGAALDALESAALAEAGAPLLVCALARPAFTELRPFWGERAARRAIERLEPLARASAAQVCRELLRPAEAVPAQAVERLVARAQGVPLLLVELVRGLQRGGLVRKHPQGGSFYLATDELDRFPDLPLVEWLAEAEVRALPPDLVVNAQLVALLGEDVTPEEVGGVLGELTAAGLGAAFPLDAQAASRRLVTLGLLAEHRSGRMGYRLPLVRDAIARAAPEAHRRAIHEAARRFYGRPGSVPERVRLARLAVHASASGRRAEAASAYLRLAVDRARRHAYLDAEGLYTRALEHLPAESGGHQLAALRGRGAMRNRAGRHEDAIADFVAARAMAHDLGDRQAEVECLLDEAAALDWTSYYAACEGRVAEAIALAEAPSPALRARLELGRGRALLRASRWAEAAAVLEGAIALAAGDEGYETAIASLLLLGAALPPLGRLEEAEEALDRARRISTKRGDLTHLSIVHMNRRNLALARGDLDAAVAGQLEGLRIARELGLVGVEYFSEYNLAELHYQASALERAAPHLARADELERVHPEIAPLPLSQLLRARMLTFSGDLPGARRFLAGFGAGVERARALGWRGAEVGPSEAVLADAVDLATREATDAQWEALLARSARDSVEQEPLEVLELRGLSALRAGRRDAARAALEAALELSGRIPGLLARRVRRTLAAVARP